MTSHLQTPDESNPEQFYGPLADAYDRMTGLESRFTKAGQFLTRLAAGGPLGSVLDVACGTGLYALAAAKLGTVATGADLSAEMLHQAEKNSAAMGLKVSWQQAPMQELRNAVQGTFDLIMCMGNSLPHLLTEADLISTLSGFHTLLNPGGRLVVQVLNYTKILEERERVVSVDRHADTEFIRFYDFLTDENLVRFNILTVRWQGQAPEHSIHSVKLRPYQQHELTQAIEAGGFQGCDAYGDFRLSPFNPGASATLLVRCPR